MPPPGATPKPPVTSRVSASVAGSVTMTELPACTVSEETETGSWAKLTTAGVAGGGDERREPRITDALSEPKTDDGNETGNEIGFNENAPDDSGEGQRFATS